MCECTSRIRPSSHESFTKLPSPRWLKVKEICQYGEFPIELLRVACWSEGLKRCTRQPLRDLLDHIKIVGCRSPGPDQRIEDRPRCVREVRDSGDQVENKWRSTVPAALLLSEALPAW